MKYKLHGNYVFTHLGTIEEKITQRKSSRWQVDTSNGKLILLVTCPNCSSIITIGSSHIRRINERGCMSSHGADCAMCMWCQGHFWFVFKGWEKLHTKTKESLGAKAARL